MNLCPLFFILLSGLPALSQAASVSDLALLNDFSSSTFQETSKDQQAHQLGNLHDGSNSHLASGSHQAITGNNSITQALRKTNPQFSEHAPRSNNYLASAYEHIVSSNDLIWQELTASAKEINNSLNQINHWAASFLNASPANTDLAAISLRNVPLGQQSTNLSTVIDKEHANPELSALRDGNAPDLLKEDLNLIQLLLSPAAIFKVLAQNIGVIIGTAIALMSFKLLARFVTEKIKKRQRRTKGRKRRGIDGFID